MALKLTRNATEAEDLMQETYVKAWRRFDTYTPTRPFLNWLLRIMQRAYLDNRRRENPIRKPESLNTMATSFDGEAQELSLPDASPTPDRQALTVELRGALVTALEELPSRYREAILLCDVEDRSYAEIAESQNTSIGTVRSRIHRGRRLLRTALRERGLA